MDNQENRICEAKLENPCLRQLRPLSLQSGFEGGAHDGGTLLGEQMLRTPNLLLILITFSCLAGPVAADVIVVSSREYRGSGSYVVTRSPVTETLVPTTYNYVPFPQDASNAVSQNGGGLQVLVNQSGRYNAIKPQFSNLYNVNQNWTVQGFDVTFDVTGTETYQISGPMTGASFPYHYTLTGPAGLVADYYQGFAPKTGTLVSGTYTISGVTATDGPMPTSYTDSFISDAVNGSFSVTPEPAAVALVAAPCVALLRRRSPSPRDRR